MRRDFSSPGRMGSTSTLPCAATTRRPGCTSSTASMPSIWTRRLDARLLVSRSHWLASCVRSLRLVARLLVVRIAPALLSLCRASGCAVSPLDFSSVGRTGSRRVSGHSVSLFHYSSSGLYWLYCAYVVHPDVPSRRSTSRRPVALALTVRPVAASRGTTTHRPDCTGSTAPMPCIQTHCLNAQLLVSRSHWLSPCVPGLSVVRRDYPSRGHNGYTSPTPRVRVPRHVARLVTWLVVDNFDYAAHPGASARRAARHVACRTAHRRLLRLRRASGCLGTSCGSSRGLSHRSSSTTSPTPRVRVPRHVGRLVTQLVAPFVVNLDYTTHPGDLACRAARCAARRRLLRLRRASGCLGTLHGSSRGSSHRSSSTTSPTPCVRIPRHVAPLVVGYFAYAAHPGASVRHAARHAARC
jgi:hypothetical protein